MRVQRKHHMVIVLLTVMTLIITSFPLAGASYASGYSVSKSVSYAQKWANGFNDSQYKRINDDCTNFVSQCIAAGGKNFINPKKLNISATDWLKGYKCTTESHRWYNKKYTYKKLGIKKGVFCYSSSFTFVEDFYNFWRKQRCCSTYGTYTDCTKNSAFQKMLKKGDIIQMYDKGIGWHHSMIITSGRSGDWNYCAHTVPAKDQPLKNINKKNRSFRVIRINY